jgi:oxalate decarboxylase/phosphoglucose isomerase-like protein (cupin superfamily)
MIRLIKLPQILNEKGNLSVIEEELDIPFKIKRIYWIYDVPGGEIRGSHAFRETEELIVALSGSFDVVLHDGTENKNFSLNRSYYGVYVPKLTWRKIENFSTNSLALILSSTTYNEDDYIRDFDNFLSIVR